MTLRRVLIANRGEIARRVIRAARVRGIESVAVFSEADAQSPYVLEADISVAIGPPEARLSYLDPDKILAAAKATGADAIHPGYGFLSENASFARAVIAAGLTWIGPPPDSIEAVGDKRRAREVAKAAGVPTVPGYEGPDDDATLVREANRIGFPLLVKASAGGGGKGMRKVLDPAGLADAIASARREAESSFGNGRLILERCIERARHIEVQILGDHFGHVVALLERDCSLQRRHQKVIEECPSPSIDATSRASVLAMGVAVAKAAGYANAGTAEFLLAPDGAFYFLEMNTRLQVEHPVTEEVTGVDLVGWQFAIAAGKKLTLTQDAIASYGHAMEFRLYAEDPASGFLPQPGLLRRVKLPAGPGIRVDACAIDGMEVTGFYDPMIAKIIAHGANREEARLRLIDALRQTVVLGVRTNTAWVLDVLNSDPFINHTLDTTWAERELAERPWLQPSAPDSVWYALAAFLSAGRSDSVRSGSQGQSPKSPSPFDATDGFRLVRRSAE